MGKKEKKSGGVREGKMDYSNVTPRSSEKWIGYRVRVRKKMARKDLGGKQLEIGKMANNILLTRESG